MRPAFLHPALADRPVDEPTHSPCVEFPCRTTLPHLPGALFNGPTMRIAADAGFFEGQEKKRLTFDMNGDCSPTLFETLDGLVGNA